MNCFRNPVQFNVSKKSLVTPDENPFFETIPRRNLHLSTRNFANSNSATTASLRHQCLPMVSTGDRPTRRARAKAKILGMGS